MTTAAPPVPVAYGQPKGAANAGLPCDTSNDTRAFPYARNWSQVKCQPPSKP